MPTLSADRHIRTHTEMDKPMAMGKFIANLPEIVENLRQGNDFIKSNIIF